MGLSSNVKQQLDNLNEEEKKVFYTILSSSVHRNQLDTRFLERLYLSDYREIPVSIDQFLEDNNYLGKIYDQGRLIYPFWRHHLHNIFHDNPDNAWEQIFTGAIGVGKSTIAAIGLMYLIYRTLCLKDPQKFYSMPNNAPIVFVVLNITLDLAYSGLYTIIVEAFRQSPWFNKVLDIRGKYEFTITFPNNIQLICASNVSHTIGKNVLGCILDEINYRNATVGSKNNVLNLYRNIRRRMESRFLKQGRLPGLLFLVSSKNSDQDFLDKYIQSLKMNKSTWVVDKAIYDIKPPETYTGKRFKVAVGDRSKESYIILSEEDETRAKERDYNIITVPEEYRVAFEQNINDALKDICGISSISSNKLIPYSGRIDRCFHKDKRSPFMVEQIELGLGSVEDIKDYLDDLSILKRDLEKPRFAHIDIGLRNDRLGLCVLHQSKPVEVERFNIDGAVESISENLYDVDLYITIKALPGNEVPLFKVREFLIWLSFNIGFKFKKITFDGFQSADSIQLLKIAGYDAALLSVDRTDIPYLGLRTCILEERLDSYYNQIVVEEIEQLEYDQVHKKVDHPLVLADGTPGSKDTSDGLAGALYNAQEYYIKHTKTRLSNDVNRSIALDAIKKINNLRKIQEERENDITSWL